jgi:predicted alpha/beta superfamily hydrolase
MAPGEAALFGVKHIAEREGFTMDNLDLLSTLLGNFQSLLKAKVTFDVELTPLAATDEELFIVGNVPDLGNWKSHEFRLAKAADRRYTASLSLPAGFPVQFKITRGRWGKEEVRQTGRARSNRIYVPKLLHGNLISCQVEGWADSMQVSPIHTLTGKIERLPKVSSKVLKHSRDVLVYLPGEYELEKQKKYPVCFLLDGQNMFDASTSFAGIEWDADATLHELEKKGLVEPIIAVAIYNTPLRRFEFTPTPGNGGGGLNLFAHFLMDELTPMLKDRFRVQMDSGRTGVIGSSLGGLAAFHLGWKYPDFFQRLGVVSPSLWWDNAWTIHLVRGEGKKKDLRIWLDIGELEGAIPFLWGSTLTVKQVTLLKKALCNLGWHEGRDLKVTVDPEGSHDEASWSRRFPHLITFLYGRETNDPLLLPI